MKSFPILYLLCAIIMLSISGESAPRNLIDTITYTADTSFFASAVNTVGLADMLNSAGPWTLLIPNNAAFGRLESALFRRLLRPEYKEYTRNILLQHTIKGLYTSESIRKMGNSILIPTMQGANMRVKVLENGAMTAGGAKVLRVDTIASNGVIHIIDTVVMPPGGNLIFLTPE